MSDQELAVPQTRRLDELTMEHYDSYEDRRVTLGFQVRPYARTGTFQPVRYRIDLIDTSDGQPWATLTVNEPAVKLEPGEFLVKGWSENGAVRRSAAASGYFVDTGKRSRMGYVEAEVWSLADGVVLR